MLWTTFKREGHNQLSQLQIHIKITFGVTFVFEWASGINFIFNVLFAVVYFLQDVPTRSYAAPWWLWRDRLSRSRVSFPSAPVLQSRCSTLAPPVNCSRRMQFSEVQMEWGRWSVLETRPPIPPWSVIICLTFECWCFDVFLFVLVKGFPSVSHYL